MDRHSREAARFITVTCAIALLPALAAAQVDPQRAETYFKEAAVLCERDGGRLWGVSLCGPMVFADAGTKTIATNQPAPAGDRPGILGFANAPVEWGGTSWTSYVWGFLSPDDPRQRAVLMLHELFHRIQPQLGLLATTSSGNDHLDTLDGRYWLQLEWRALAEALRSAPSRPQTVRDALAFRAARRALFPEAAEAERVQEINEGLAQYTGTVLAAGSADEAASSAIAQLAQAEAQETFVSTFAYASGAGYGALLDLLSPGWTRRVRVTSDLGGMLVEAGALQAAESAATVASRYDGPKLRATEERRDAERKARVAELQRLFVEGPVLLLPWGRRATFDSRGATPMPGGGTILRGYRVTDEWGTFETTTGVLVSRESRTLTVPAPENAAGPELAGDGWTLKVAPGWAVRPGPRPNDLQVVRDEK
jgi:hypothetical protein